MKLKKYTAFLLAFMLIFIIGCKKNANGPSENQGVAGNNTASITLLYCSNDTFNPYTLKTKVNNELCQLLYEPLISLDNNYNSVYRLAQSAVQNQNVWTITLRGTVFSDGSAVTGEDVVYSFNKAKANNGYSSALSHVSSVSSEGNKIVFTLTHSDPYFINLLNFPIIKANSDNLKNEDSVLLAPIGSGRYVLNNEQTALNLNDKYYGAKSKYSVINLVDAPDSESVAHYVEVGATDLYYASANDSDIFRMDGKKFVINQNRLVYLGVNLNNPVLQNVKIRYAISAALGRDKIVSTAYFGNAVAANGPISPYFKETLGHQTIESSANSKIAIENLEQIGYNILDNLGYRKNANNISLAFSLLINKENASHVLAAEIIKSQLSEVGIKVTVTALDFSSYTSALKSKSFQLYLAEVKINNNFDISPLITAGGSCAYGIPAGSGTSGESSEISLTEIITKYKTGNASISDVITAVSSQMPFIPVCYRSGMIFYSENIGNVENASADDLFSFIKN